MVTRAEAPFINAIPDSLTVGPARVREHNRPIRAKRFERMTRVAEHFAFQETKLPPRNEISNIVIDRTYNFATITIKHPQLEQPKVFWRNQSSRRAEIEGDHCIDISDHQLHYQEKNAEVDIYFKIPREADLKNVMLMITPTMSIFPFADKYREIRTEFGRPKRQLSKENITEEPAIAIESLQLSSADNGKKGILVYFSLPEENLVFNMRVVGTQNEFIGKPIKGKPGKLRMGYFIPLPNKNYTGRIEIAAFATTGKQQNQHAFFNTQCLVYIEQNQLVVWEQNPIVVGR